MKERYVEELDCLIDSSISIYKKTGQTVFNRIIQVPVTDRVTQDLIDAVTRNGECMNTPTVFSETLRGFTLTIDVHKARLSLAQAQAHVV